MREWMKRGEILRQKRERLDLSLREYARLHGWKSPELSDAERGRINPENFLNVQMEARRE
jgi:transcriptional regulator with XRE-family HTH domain